MKALRKTEDSRSLFIVTDVDPAYHQALSDLEFYAAPEGFAKAFPASPQLERIFENFARDVDTLVLQTACVLPVHWEQALLTFLEAVEPYQDIDWWLVGSAALAVRGIDVRPRDIDLSVDDVGAQKLGEVLLDYLVQPVEYTPGWFCNWFGRAFIGARLEWVGAVDKRADTPDISDFGPTAASRREAINWHGYTLYVPPLDLQLRVSEERGLTERAEKIRQATQ